MKELLKRAAVEAWRDEAALFRVLSIRGLGGVLSSFRSEAAEQQELPVSHVAEPEILQVA